MPTHDTSNGNQDARGRGWTIDRRIPIAVILTMMLQFGAAVWWLANLDSRVREDDRRIVDLQAQQNTLSNRLEERNDQLMQQIQDIKVTAARSDERLQYLMQHFLPEPEPPQKKR